MTTAQQSRTDLVAQNGKQTIQAEGRGLVLRDLDQMWRFASAVVKSGMAPKSLRSAEQVLVALQMGAEVGLTPMQSLANIAVVNGRPVMWGDALVALVRRSKECEYIHDSWSGEGEKRVATCAIKRRGQPEESRSFGYADAKRAGLLSRDTYKLYLDRMLQCRARAWAIRDVFADLLMGLAVAEEVQDEAFADTMAPNIESGDDAPMNSLDDVVNVMDQDEQEAEFAPAFDGNPGSTVTPEEAAEFGLFDKGGEQYR